MKKKLILTISIVLVFALTIFIVMQNNEKVIYESGAQSIKTTDALALMYETEYQSGEYVVSNDTTWPTEGYIFNAELSKCENGSTLYWDSETNKVMMEATTADKCYIYFDRYSSVNITGVTTSNITNSSITLTVNATAGENGISKYYYSKDNGNSYEESTSNSYTFSGLSIGTEYIFKVYIVDTAGYKSNEYSISETTADAVYLADYIKGLYTSQGANGLYYHDADLANGAGDNSYRYSGANPNNYVCFGSDAASCPEDNLYRIIGVFDNQVKLIKSTSYGNYAWDSEYDNTWDEDTKPDIYTTLNTTYWNTLGSKWQGLIDLDHKWEVGGMTHSQTNTAKQYYDTEIKNQSGYEETMAIGLMYVSDYGYASDYNDWSIALYDYFYSESYSDNNWLYLGSYEWTISRSSGSTGNAFIVRDTGYVHNRNVTISSVLRPSFYLESSVTYVSGSGSQADPLRIG